MRLLLSTSSQLWQRKTLLVVASVAIVVPVSYIVANNPATTTTCLATAQSSNNNDTTSMQHALVVGGTSGIGHGIALALAKRGNIAVTIAGRSQERGMEIVKQLEQVSSGKHHSFQQVDAFDLASVKKLSENGNVDLLVLTQGMATTQGYTPTVNGLDQKLQLHYFSRVYLARLLAQKQKQPLKVLSVLSAGVHNRYEQFEHDFELKQHYSIKNAADAAGFYNDAGLETLALEFPSSQVCHACPGFVNTNWGTEFPWYLRGIVRCLQPLGRSIEKCGDLLTEGFLSLPEDGDKNFFLIDQDGKLIQDGVKHTPEERQLIWTKTLEVLPKD